MHLGFGIVFATVSYLRPKSDNNRMEQRPGSKMEEAKNTSFVFWSHPWSVLCMIVGNILENAFPID